MVIHIQTRSQLPPRAQRIRRAKFVYLMKFLSR